MYKGHPGLDTLHLGLDLAWMRGVQGWMRGVQGGWTGCIRLDGWMGMEMAHTMDVQTSNKPLCPSQVQTVFSTLCLVVDDTSVPAAGR